MAFDGTLKFDTSIDKSGFKLGLDGLGGLAQKGMSLVTGAITAATGAISALGAKAVSVGKGFESSFAQLRTIMDADAVSVGEMSGALRTLSAEMGVSASELAKTAYDAISATGDTAGAIDIVTNASQLAVAGFTDSASALSTLTTVMNAYGMTAEETAQISDSLIMVQNLGVTTVSQLSASMGKAIASASAYGVDLYNLESAYVSMTKAGINTAESTTYISSMLKELGDSGSDVSGILAEKTGKSFAELMDSGKTLGDVLGILSDSVNGDATALMNLWGSAEAGKASNAILSQGLKEFNDNLELIQTSTGATQTAFETMSETLGFKLDQLKQSGVNVLSGIYDEMQPALVELAELGLESVSQLSDAFNAGGFEGLAESLGDVLGQDVTKLSSYVPKLSKIAVSLVQSLVKGLTSNAPAIANAGLSAGMTLLKGIFSISADLLEFGASLLVTLAESITEQLPEINIAARYIIWEIEGVLFEYLPLLIEAGVSIITSLAGVLIENLPLMIEAGISILTALIDSIADNIDLMISTALTVIQTLCESLLNGENLQKLLESGLNLLMSLAQAIVDNLPLLIDIAIQILTFLCTELLSADNIEKLIDAAFQIITALTDAIVDNIDTILLAVEEIIFTLCDELLSTENLEKLIETGAELLGKLIVGLCQVTGKLIGFALILFEELTETFNDIDWGALGTAIVEGICSGLLDCDFVLSDFLDDFGDNWLTGIKEIFGIHSPSKVMHDEVGEYLALGIGEGFADEAAAIGQSITQTVSGWTTQLSGTVQQTAQSVVQTSKSAFDKLPSEIARPLNAVGTPLTQWGSTIAEKGKTAGKAFLDGTKSFVDKLPGDTGAKLTETLTASVRWGSDLAALGKDAASDFLDNIMDSVKQLPGKAQQQLTDTLSRVVSWGVSLVQRGRDAAQSLVSAIVNAVSSLPSVMTDIGTNLVSGLWNGITSMDGWLRDQITGFAGGIIDGFRETFGIASPSKVMRDEVGKYLAEGIGVGFTDTIPKVAKTALYAFEKQLRFPELQLSVSQVGTDALRVSDDLKVLKEMKLLKLRDADRQDMPRTVPKADSGALQAFRAYSADSMSGIAYPGATSQIINNYTYNTATTNNTQNGGSVQPVVNVHATIKMDEDVIAEKVAEKVDVLQGEAITFDERGTAH